MSKARGWQRCGCYVWRTRKPHSFLGLPFIGRHFAYVGETGNRYFRDRQHLYGDSRYGAAGKSWADLAPKVYPLPCLFPRWAAARKAQETLWIWLLWPVYNDKKNRWNPRRISLTKAQQQRWARAASGLKANVGRAAARLVLLAGAWTALGWGVFEWMIR